MAKFISKTHACLNVVTPSGSNVHVSFTEQAGGGSVYYTNDPELLAALRNHHRFNKLFTEVEMPVKMEKSVVAPKAEEDPADEAPKKKVKEFSNNEDAKEYFAEHFDVSRSKLRTRASIEEVAKGLGVTVIWKE